MLNFKQHHIITINLKKTKHFLTDQIEKNMKPEIAQRWEKKNSFQRKQKEHSYVVLVSKSEKQKYILFRWWAGFAKLAIQKKIILIVF